MLRKFTSVISGILLVMGTCIGAGMLALPVVTGLAGFMPALVINFLCFAFMAATGLLLLEAIFWLEDGSNVLTLAQFFFGSIGKWIGGIAFLFLYYCLEVSYCAGGAPAFTSAIHAFFGVQINGMPSYFLFVLLFGSVVYLGASTVNRLNWLLMTGLILSFFLLIGVGTKEIKMSLLQRADWRLTLTAAPVLFGAYGYHNLLPSLSTHLKRDRLSLRVAVILGTLLTFLTYSIWQWMIIGTLSKKEIIEAETQGIPVTQALQDSVGYPLLSLFAEFFGFFALVTSFLGVSLSMVDFMADGLRLKNKKFQRILICFLIFIPPALFAAFNPGVFIEAIGIAGGFGEALLNGLFPIGMVWMGRYVLKLPIHAQLGGGKPLLILLFLFTLLIICVETHHLIYE